MKNVMGLVFANIYDSSLGQLTNKRTQASLPYGGRYRQIDFTLSNMSNAGIRHIGIITQYNYQSLMNHIGSGEEWDLELEENGLEFITPFSSGHPGSFRGKLDAIESATDHLRYAHEDYVILADAAVLCAIDLEEVVRKHIESSRDITVVVTRGIANSKKQLDLAVNLDVNGEITDMAVDYAAPADYLASMGLFVMRRDFLMEKAAEAVAHSRYRLERELILKGWTDAEFTVGAYEFHNVALFNESTDEYFRNNLALIDADTRKSLFREGLTIYTKVRDQVPCYYGEHSEIDNCIVADGCLLLGAAEHSVFFRGVRLSTGAFVKNCVVMANTEIGIGAHLEYCILDKDVKINAGVKLIGTAEHPVILNRGDVV